MNAQWTAAPANPPASNATAPINVSGTYQAKLGDLGAVRMRAGEYCDAAGLNCFSAASSSPGGGDTITVGGQCFEPAITVNCWWNWSGTGNDTAAYIIEQSQDPVAYCTSIGRGYGSHTKILAQCQPYKWQASAWGSCQVGSRQQCGSQGNNCYTVTTYKQDRTVTCINKATGAAVADSLCTDTKPATTQATCS